MNRNEGSPLTAGAALVWGHQRILWWLFVINLALASWGVHSVVQGAGDILNHSLAAARLVNGFSFGAFQELSNLPSQPLEVTGSRATGMIYFLFVLLITGGILEVYRRDVSLSTADFFGAGARCFWRFVRMCILLLLALIPVALIAWGLFMLANHYYRQSISDAPGLWLHAANIALTLLLMMIVRLWFDMAQVIAVVEDERRARRALGAAFRLLRANFGSLFWLFFRISFITGVVFFGGIAVWVKFIPHSAIAASFIISQLLIVFSLATRLWQRAGEMAWYEQHGAASVTVPIPVDDGPVYASPSLSGDAPEPAPA
jgi:hypothetical protein